MITYILVYFLMSAASAEKTNKVNINMEEKMKSGVSGNLVVEQLKKGIKITGEIKGLKPNSKHGFHIHQNADCSAEDAKSAGSHFNPTSTKHGGPKEDNSHAGDLGNVVANEKGVVKIDLTDKDLVLYPETSKLSVLNRSVIIHAKADDLDSQPSGDAGDRLACGAIVKN